MTTDIPITRRKTLNNPLHRLALYVATILISALPLTTVTANTSDEIKVTMADNLTKAEQEQRKMKQKS